MRATSGNRMWSELAVLRSEVDSVRVQSQSTTASTAAMILKVREEVRDDQEDMDIWVSQFRHDFNEIGEAVMGVQHGVIDHHNELVSARR